MKIGVVGSGIAGLVAAWLFSRRGHHVALFEKNQELGLSSAGIKLPDLSAEIDVPLRLFNARHWRLLSRVYDELQIEVEPVSVSQSFVDRHGDCYLNIDLDSIFKTKLSDLFQRKSRRILQQAQRFRTVGLQDLSALSFKIQFADYLESRGFDGEFANEFLYPILSATVCTCSVDALRNYPARLLLEVMERITPRFDEKDTLFRASNGTRQIAERLSDVVDEIRFGTTVDSIQRGTDEVKVMTTDDSGSRAELFDHVVIATQANHAASLIDNPSDLECRMLQSFDYEDVGVVTHTDSSFLPADSKSWATFNFQTKQEANGASQAMCTIWLNGFSNQYSSDKNFFQTINPWRTPENTQVIAKRRLSRPVVSQKSLSGWRMLDQLNREVNRNVWFVGSYAVQGVPLLETGVESAINVAGKLGVDISLYNEAMSVPKSTVDGTG